jgi:predicted small secreted protein
VASRSLVPAGTRSKAGETNPHQARFIRRRSEPGFAIGPKREEIMRTDLWTKLTALVIGACAIALAACNTVEGAGQDIKQTGSSIENSANRAKQP